MEKSLQLVFKNAAGTTKIITISNPKEHLSKAETDAAMQKIVAANVFNTIGGIANSLWVFIPVFLIGHSLNFALNLLGCYVHDLRLQCLEYFGKFYKDGGRAFKPLEVSTKYYDIAED